MSDTSNLSATNVWPDTSENGGDGLHSTAHFMAGATAAQFGYPWKTLLMRTLSLVVALVLFASACGGGESSSEPETTAATATTAATPSHNQLVSAGEVFESSDNSTWSDRHLSLHYASCWNNLASYPIGGGDLTITLRDSDRILIEKKSVQLPVVMGGNKICAHVSMDSDQEPDISQFDFEFSNFHSNLATNEWINVREIQILISPASGASVPIGFWKKPGVAQTVVDACLTWDEATAYEITGWGCTTLLYDRQIVALIENIGPNSIPLKYVESYWSAPSGATGFGGTSSATIRIPLYNSQCEALDYSCDYDDEGALLPAGETMRYTTTEWWNDIPFREQRHPDYFAGLTLTDIKTTSSQPVFKFRVDPSHNEVLIQLVPEVLGADKGEWLDGLVVRQVGPAEPMTATPTTTAAPTTTSARSDESVATSEPTWTATDEFADMSVSDWDDVFNAALIYSWNKNSFGNLGPLNTVLTESEASKQGRESNAAFLNHLRAGGSVTDAVGKKLTVDIFTNAIVDGRAWGYNGLGLLEFLYSAFMMMGPAHEEEWEIEPNKFDPLEAEVVERYEQAITHFRDSPALDALRIRAASIDMTSTTFDLALNSVLASSWGTERPVLAVVEFHEKLYSTAAASIAQLIIEDKLSSTEIYRLRTELLNGELDLNAKIG